MRRIADERGMTLIEVVVAALLMVLGSLTVLSIIDASIRNTFRAQAGQVRVDRLQQELEKMTQTPYAQLALTGLPAGSADPNSPAARVSGTNFGIDRAGTVSRPLAYNGGGVPQGGTVSGGTISPGGPTDPAARFTSGNVSGTIYRYVVWDNSTNCPAPAAPCMKRAIVAAVLDKTASGGPRVYQEVQSQIFDPNAKRTGGNDPNGSNTVPWTFWLTDTACNFAARQPIVAQHATHNTRSTCGTANSGSRTGSNAGPPDLMYTQAPPVDPAFPDNQQPLYDYATDVEPSSGGNNDAGLQELSSGNCTTMAGLVDDLPLLGNLLDGNNYLKIHKWLSPKVPAGFNNILFHGNATLNLWTRTVNGGVYSGGICVWLFARELNILGLPVDVPILNVTNVLDPDYPLNLNFVPYRQNPWPSGNWSEISIPLPISAGTNLAVGYQLGLAIAVDQSKTGGGLEFAYDAPSYDSRLQIQTTGSLPF